MPLRERNESGMRARWGFGSEFAGRRSSRGISASRATADLSAICGSYMQKN